MRSRWTCGSTTAVHSWMGGSSTCRTPPHAPGGVCEMIGPGTARVRLEILPAPAAVGQPHFGVQVGAFRNRENADRLRRAMEAKYGRARLVQRADTPGWWHVVVGMESTQDGASAL